MRTEEEIVEEIENAELMISIDHLKEYNMIKKHWLNWVLNESEVQVDD